MAKTANLTVRMDEDVKKDAEYLFNSMGMTFSEAVNIFVYQSLIRHKLPFEIISEIPNEETLQAMKEADELIKDPKAKRYSDIRELLEELGIDV